MKTVLTTNTIGKLIALTSLLAAMACSGEDPNSDSSQNPVKGANGQCDDGESDDGPEDKINCSTDADCDSDEICMDALCTGLDGEAEDDDTEAGEAADDCEDDEEGDDKITCAVDGDCDSDEVCTDGLCTGLPEACATDADCDSDEACTNGLCEDR